MPTLKPRTILPTREEDAAITKAARSDPDARPFTNAQWAAVQRAGLGRPPLASPKRALTVRYDADVVEAFKATGRGWQTRMNAALKDWLKTHSPTQVAAHLGPRPPLSE